MRMREGDEPDDDAYTHRRWSLDRKISISTILAIVVAGTTAYFDIKSDIRSIKEDKEWFAKMQAANDNRQDLLLRETVEGIRRDIASFRSEFGAKLERVTEQNSYSNGRSQLNAK